MASDRQKAMPTRLKLLALAERCEAATGPDRELDAAIAVETFNEPHGDGDFIYAKPVQPSDDCAPGTFWRKSRSGLSLRTAPHYTQILHQARGLVAPNIAVCVQWNPQPPHLALIGRQNLLSHKPTMWRGDGATAELALCAAAIRALAAQEEAPDGK